MNRTDIKTDAYSIVLLCNSLNAQHISALHRGDEHLSNLLLIAQGTINKLCEEKQERKTGEWIRDGDGITLTCDNCGYIAAGYNDWDFCPICGTDMRGEET